MGSTRNATSPAIPLSPRERTDPRPTESALSVLPLFVCQRFFQILNTLDLLYLLKAQFAAELPFNGEHQHDVSERIPFLDRIAAGCKGQPLRWHIQRLGHSG